MVHCLCGEKLAESVGDNHIVTPSEKFRWLRREIDYVTCPRCERTFTLAMLRALAVAGRGSPIPVMSPYVSSGSPLP